MVTIGRMLGVERWTLLIALVLLWVWLSRPARARWAGRLGAERITLAIGGAILLNLLLVAAIPRAAELPGTAGTVVPALMRQVATIATAVSLMIAVLRWGCQFASTSFQDGDDSAPDRMSDSKPPG
jgi:hypothetical protein